jgi:hypothetical protein
MHGTAHRRGRTRAAHRAQLSAAVDRLAGRLASGRLEPPLGELAGLAAALDADHMAPEAARIRRWLAAPRTADGGAVS